MKEMYTRKGQMGRNRRFYAEYADAISDVPSYERVSLKGSIDQGWTRFKIQGLPGGVIKISRLPDKKILRGGGDIMEAELKRLADSIAGRLLAKGFTVQRYDAHSTNSVYLKLDYGVCNSIRMHL